MHSCGSTRPAKAIGIMATGRTYTLWKVLPLLALATLLTACGGGDGSTSGSGATTASSATTGGSNTKTGNTTTTSSGTTTTSSGTTTSDALTISGSAATTIVAGQTYSFQPSATNSGGGALTFSISNQPSWASFNTATGLLSGTPTAVEAASYSNITISVSNGQESASLAPFTIVVTAAAATTGSATLSWEAPQENTNGTPLTDLAGYTIYYGTSSAAMTQTIQITDPTQTTYVVNNLSAGTYYFSVAADAADGTQSAQSALGSKTIM